MTDILRKLYLCTLDRLVDFFEVMRFKVKRQLTCEHFVSHYTQRPNIAFVTVFFLVHDLRSHIGRWAYDRGHHVVQLWVIFRKTEIPYFEYSILDKNIIGLDVSIIEISVTCELSRSSRALRIRWAIASNTRWRCFRPEFSFSIFSSWGWSAEFLS